MTSYIKNPKTLRKSNKANVKFTLWTKGEMSRLQLAKELGLTTPSITQLINELEQNNEVSEGVVNPNSFASCSLDISPFVQRVNLTLALLLFLKVFGFLI